MKNNNDMSIIRRHVNERNENKMKMNRFGAIFWAGPSVDNSREKGSFHAWSNVWPSFFLEGVKKKSCENKKSILGRIRIDKRTNGEPAAPHRKITRIDIYNLHSPIRNTQIFICHWRTMSEWERIRWGKRGKRRRIKKKKRKDKRICQPVRDFFFFFYYSPLIIIYFPSFFPTHAAN